MKYLQFIFIIFILLTSCTSREKPDIEPIPEPKPEIVDSVYVGFNMYFLKDEKLNGSTVSYTDLKELELQNKPFVSQENIQYYDSSAHVIHLKKEVSLPGMGVSVFGKPFVVVTDSIRHYLGVIWPMYSSASYCGPIIDVTPRFYPNDIVRISLGRTPGSDSRLNHTIIQTLKQYKVLHAGITCTINNVDIVDNDMISNKCKLNYTFTIKNNDEFDLYVFDPLKMGNPLFHYYNNGVYFIGNENVYQSTSGSQAPQAGADKLNWLTKIDSKGSITRTVQKSGYPYIPPGSYKCGFRFSGLNSIAKSERQLPDGRIWIGEVTTEYSARIK